MPDVTLVGRELERHEVAARAGDDDLGLVDDHGVSSREMYRITRVVGGPDWGSAARKAAVLQRGIDRLGLALVLASLRDLGDDLTVAGVGQRVEEHDDDRDQGGHRGQQPRRGADAPFGGLGLRLDAGGVPAERECVRGERSADGLAGLAGEGEQGVDDALGADAGLPLAVLDGVGLERPDEHVHQGDADLAQHQAGECQRRGARRARGRP